MPEELFETMIDTHQWGEKKVIEKVHKNYTIFSEKCQVCGMEKRGPYYDQGSFACAGYCYILPNGRWENGIIPPCKDLPPGMVIDSVKGCGHCHHLLKDDGARYCICDPNVGTREVRFVRKARPDELSQQAEPEKK